MLTKSNSFSRRTLLRGIGVSMALPWLESLSFAAGEKPTLPLNRRPVRSSPSRGWAFTRSTGGPRARERAWNSGRA